MPFFLEKLGVKLAKFEPDVTKPPLPLNDPEPRPTKPYLSPCGFELSAKEEQVVDLMDNSIRATILESFSGVGLIVQDTKISMRADLSISPLNLLIATVPSINQACSKLHVEDISPISNIECNHDDIKCEVAHYDIESLLIEVGDYLACDQEQAIFRVVKEMLYIRVGRKWKSIGVVVKLPDDFYTLERENFF